MYNFTTNQRAMLLAVVELPCHLEIWTANGPFHVSKCIEFIQISITVLIFNEVLPVDLPIQ